MTTPQPAALLPCPHCGKTDTLKVISASDFWDDTEDAPYMHTETYGVFCDASRPDGPGGCGASSGFKETAQQAIETWNTRTALAALQPKPAEVSDDVGRAFYELSCDACGMSPSWGALTWGALTQNERDRQRQAATRFLALRPAQQATPDALANAWDEAYRLGVEDERTSEANIGVAGFGAKVNPARQNPYRAHQATPGPVGEPVAEVVWYDPQLDHFQRKDGHKIIDASTAFMDAAPLGTKLYIHAPQRVPMTDEQMTPMDRFLADSAKETEKHLLDSYNKAHGITAQAKGGE